MVDRRFEALSAGNYFAVRRLSYHVLQGVLMSQLLRRRPSPALVIASLALVFALTGTGIAAVAALPRNSVGTRQLRNNAVISSKVRNHSLLARDFRRGQLPRGPVGPACPTGQRALGGGVYLGDSTPDNQDAIIRSAPVNSTGGTGFTLLAPGQTPNAWYGEAFNAGTNGATVRVYVICAA